MLGYRDYVGFPAVTSLCITPLDYKTILIYTRPMNTTPSRTPAGSKGLQQIIVKVDQQKARRFKVLCAKHGVSQTSVIRKAIDEYLKNV